MADVKISALPAATVPLAGTEVLPIVQSATTRQVSVANLTAGRSVGGTNFIPSGSAAPTNGMYLPTTDTLGFSTNSGERVRIDSTGLTGIGTTTSTRRLQVGSGTGDQKTAIGQSLICLAANSGNLGYVNEVGFGGNGSTNVQCAIGSIVTSATAAGNGALYFATRSVTTDTAPTERMRIDSTGNVLINTTTNTNSAKLKSKVSAGAVGFEVTDEASSDFVIIPAVSAGVCKIGPTAGALAIQTAGTERMRITSTGGVLVGTTVDDVITNKVSGTSTVPSTTCFRVYSDVSNACAIGVTSTGSALVNWYYNGANLVGSITTNGTLTSYNVSSDYRLKENIAPMTGALAKVAQLKPVTYKWKSNGSDGQGFIAHELAEVVPDCVTGEKDAVDEDGNPKYQAMDTSHLIATLVSAIQELKAEFDAYKAIHP